MSPEKPFAAALIASPNLQKGGQKIRRHEVREGRREGQKDGEGERVDKTWSERQRQMQMHTLKQGSTHTTAEGLRQGEQSRTDGNKVGLLSLPHD